MLQWPQPLPLEDECAWLLREVGTGLLQWFNGQAVNLVAKGSAVTQQELLTQHFPGFQDHCVYKGHRVFLYERAQIFVADVWSAFKGVDLGEFKDIASITIFADHVVPAVLQHWGTLTCSPTLATVLDTSQEITPGSEEEVEIRTCSITAVEWLREYLTAQFGKQRASNTKRTLERATDFPGAYCCCCLLVNCRDLLLKSSQLMNLASKFHRNG